MLWFHKSNQLWNWYQLIISLYRYLIKVQCFISILLRFSQTFGIKHCSNVFSMLKRELSLFHPYFNIEGQSHFPWVALPVFVVTCHDLDKDFFIFIPLAWFWAVLSTDKSDWSKVLFQMTVYSASNIPWDCAGTCKILTLLYHAC